MKNILLFLIGFLSLMPIFSQNRNNFTIKGTISNTGFEGKNVHLLQFTGEKSRAIDSVIVTNGAFTFTGKVDSSFAGFIVLDETVDSENPKSMPIFVEPGVIYIEFDSIVSVSGTAINDDFNLYGNKILKLINDRNLLYEEYIKAENEGPITDSLQKETSDKFNAIKDEINRLDIAFAKANMTNKMGEFAFLGMNSRLEPEQIKEILNLANEEFKATTNVKRIAEMNENRIRTAVGKKFIDFTMQDSSGNKVSLSDYAGKEKYVLMDFWASWCGPCLKEIPNVAAAYKKYKHKGFEVVGISLDTDKEAWLKTITEFDLTWPQMSDLTENSVSKIYAIIGIPDTILLDKKGVIIAKDLHGEKLNIKLAELMP